jgi:hypothetical protein
MLREGGSRSQSSSCEGFKRDIRSMHAGELENKRLRFVFEHIEVCADCRRFEEDLRARR